MISLIFDFVTIFSPHTYKVGGTGISSFGFSLISFIVFNTSSPNIFLKKWPLWTFQLPTYAPFLADPCGISLSLSAAAWPLTTATSNMCSQLHKCFSEIPAEPYYKHKHVHLLATPVTRQHLSDNRNPHYKIHTVGKSLVTIKPCYRVERISAFSSRQIPDIMVYFKPYL